ncbi:hypothetical protein [Saccharothrix obliqua]|uniref:hypothetical protein n=1 Tax=Saccharothrix obliqua TaxID=2861747 RepID=UPI001C5D3B77|nr:hypothetical protein [Saccharothrix obliqua]MBW4720383.1 hypothetical protein [Saccharothrix obliqua]
MRWLSAGGFPDGGVVKALRSVGRMAAVVSVLLVVVVGSGFLIRSCVDAMSASRSTVEAYFRAIGSGDHEGACALLARSARDKLMAEQGTSSCPLAVAAIAEAMSPREREELARFEVEVDEHLWGDGRTELHLSGRDPLGLEYVALDDEYDREVIVDWGFNAMRLR